MSCLTLGRHRVMASVAFLTLMRSIGTRDRNLTKGCIMYTFSDWEDIRDEFRRDLDNTSIEDMSIFEAADMFNKAAKQVSVGVRKCISDKDAVAAEGRQLLERLAFRLVACCGFESGDDTVADATVESLGVHGIDPKHLELFREAVCEYRRLNS